jgi:hypothetical protein
MEGINPEWTAWVIQVKPSVTLEDDVKAAGHETEPQVHPIQDPFRCCLRAVSE